jgi:hypothetical protein
MWKYNIQPMVIPTFERVRQNQIFYFYITMELYLVSGN